MLDFLAVKILGSMSGIALAWALGNSRLDSRGIVAIIASIMIATVASPITLQVFSSHWFELEKTSETLFIASAVNGIFLTPAVKIFQKWMESKIDE